MSQDTPILTVAALSQSKPTRFEYTMPQNQAEELAKELGVSALRKLRLKGQIRAQNRKDWVLEAQLGATAVQPCAITNAPITTRIETDLRRVYVAEMPEMGSGEEEMAVDADMDPLPEEIDLAALMAEEILLALPAFPRLPDAEIGAIESRPSGAAPIDDAAQKPFASLAALRDKLSDDGDPS